jgi:hypothetical protein
MILPSEVTHSIFNQLKFDMELRGLSIHTQEEYLTKAKIFQDHFGKPATE